VSLDLDLRFFGIGLRTHGDKLTGTHGHGTRNDSSNACYPELIARACGRRHTDEQSRR
jgi:hypothetical protein